MSKIRIPIIVLASILLCLTSSIITYLVLAATGSIETTSPIELVYLVKDEEKVYDGTPLEAKEYKLESGTLKEGHKAKASFVGTITNVGSEEATLDVKIVDENGFDVTSEYNIKTNNATLKVTPRSLEYKILDATMEYNGQELSYDAFEVLNDGLVSGHTLKPEIKGSISNAGEKYQVEDVETHIFDYVGNEVTTNYEITYQLGDLTITKRNLVLSPISKTKEYDGEVLACDSYKIDYGTLVDGHIVEATYSTGIINAGTLEAFITNAKIYDKNGIDVTSNYNLSYEKAATLTVKPRDLIINMESKSKYYDRNTLTSNEYKISEDTPLIYGDKFEAISFSADNESIINVGSITNTITQYSIKNRDGLGDEVTSNYNVIINEGKLEIKKAPLTLTAISQEWIYDGLEHTLANTDGNYFTNGDLYRIDGLVDRNNEIIEFDYEGKIRDAGSASNEIILRSIKLRNSEDDIKNNYEITFIPGELTVVKAKLIVTGLSETKEYDGLELSYGNINRYESVVGLKGNEEITIKYSDNGITDVGTIKNIIEMVDISTNGKISNYDVELIHGNLTIIPRKIELEAKSNSWDYDGEVHTLESPDMLNGEALENEVSLLEGDVLEFNYSGSVTNAGSIDNKIVNVVIKKYKIISIETGEYEIIDVTKNYDISLIDGILTINPIEITLKAQDSSQEYNGKALEIIGEREVETEITNLLDGHTVYVTYSGSIINVGEEKNIIKSYRIMYGDEDVTNNYLVNTIDGKLEVKKLTVGLSVDNELTKMYDGTKLTLNSNDLTIDDLTLGELIINPITYTEVINVTENPVDFIISEIQVINSSGEDITGNLDIIYPTLAAQITKRPLTIEAYDRTVTYTPDSYDEISVAGLYGISPSTPLVLGDYLDNVSMYSPIGNVGIEEIEVDIRVLEVYNSRGVNVTNNYQITSTSAYYTVLPYEVNIELNSFYKVYDGKILDINESNALRNEIVIPGRNVSFEIVKPTDLTSVQKSKFNIVLDIKGDNLSNYSINITGGDIEIEKRDIVIIMGSQTFTYDGLSHSCTSYTVNDDVFNNDLTISVIIPSSITEVGTVQNYGYVTGSGVSNYNVTIIPGTLTVI